ncbi:MAG: YdcF family protein [Actinomycetota bacterium]
MSPLPVYDAAVVLGAMVRPDGSPSPALARRVAHAVALAKAGTVGALLMSGGPVAHPTPEAWAMRDLAVAAGITPERIVVEDRSRNTIDNARLSAPLASERGWRRLVVVTDLYHLPRALYVFRRFGLAVAGSGARPDRPAAEWWVAALREAAALPWTVVRVERARLRASP